MVNQNIVDISEPRVGHVAASSSSCFAAPKDGLDHWTQTYLTTRQKISF